MQFLYNLGIELYRVGAKLMAFRNQKARLFVAGRKNWRERYRVELSEVENPVWFHCASLGEFEQGRPVIEVLIEKIKNPVVITFFSPSGYEVMKDYDKGKVLYLPLDTQKNARDFLQILQPAAAVFVKYEIWVNYFREMETRQIPCYLISARFLPEQRFFKWYGAGFRKALKTVRHLFVQDENSLELLKEIGIQNVSVSGDTRFDRVIDIAEKLVEVPMMAAFCGEHRVLISGSSYEAEDRAVKQLLTFGMDKLKVIIAPHEVNENRIRGLVKMFEGKSVRYSGAMQSELEASQVLIIDNIGLLSRLYPYGHVALVGGGWGKGIHNTLEAAVHATPIVTGPQISGFLEAKGLLELGGLVVCDKIEGAADQMKLLLEDDQMRTEKGNVASEYVRKHAGATASIAEMVEDSIKKH